MQNKGAIILLAVLLALVSVYQLSFTWVANSVRSDAAEIAKGDLKKEAKYLDSIAGKPVYNFLFIKGFTYRECQSKELNLGLDLKGGMNVILEVSVVDLIKSLSNYNTDPAFTKALEETRKEQQNSQSDFVTLFGTVFEKINPQGKLASIFATLELKGRVEFNSTNTEVLDILRQETQDAIDNSFRILRTRIDHFGVTQPNIQRLEGASGRILVELPGIKDPERVRKLLQGTANLEFWETFENTEVFEYLMAANSKIADINEAKEKANLPDSLKNIKADTSKTAVEKTAQADTLKEKTLEQELASTDSLALQKKQMEESQKRYPLFAVMQPSVDPRSNQPVGGATVGTAHFKDTAMINHYLNMSEVKQLFPRDLAFMWTVKPIDEKTGNFFNLIALKKKRNSKYRSGAALGGEVITNARHEFNQTGGSAHVTMQMDGEGANEWKRITGQNIQRQVAVVLDGYVYSSPVVQNEIAGGSSQITGRFSIEEAKDLANVLKSGKLPVPAHIVEEEIVGPSLGQEAIDSGLMSFVIAFVIVLIYMVLYYNSAGFAANVALVVNVFLIFGVLASLGAVLTLPGLAGIVLTLGMAVDANVLIFERIREEIAIGKGFKLAISDGFKNAYSAIIDANITTLLIAIILGYFGKGPIQGFATTLGIGILTSLFTAIFITRIIFVNLIDRNKTIKFSTKLTEGAFKNAKFDFIGKRKVFYAISSVFILIGIISMVFKGFNFGVDFTGGRTFIVRFENPVSTVEVADALKVQFTQAPEVKTYGGENQVKITTKYKIEEDDIAIDKEIETKLYEGLKTYLGTMTYEQFVSQDDSKKVGRMSSQKVGPTIADDIKTKGLLSVVVSLIVIFFYIFLRFKTWQFGLGAILSLVHDTLFVLGAFSIFAGILPFSLELDQAFIAAILTVIGYSINDTVVVFDRIREHLNMVKKFDLKETYNNAINSTLSRTINTSATTLVVLLAIFIFGGEVIRGFVFALLIGIGVGTYSSIFVATPIVFDTQKVEAKVEEVKKTMQSKKKKVKTETETEA